MKHLAYLNKYLWKYRGRLTMGFLFILLGNVFNVYAPIIVGQGIDFLVDILSVESSTGGIARIPVPLVLQQLAACFGSSQPYWQIPAHDLRNKAMEVALYLGLIYLLLFLIKGVFLFFQRQTIIVMSRYIEYELKKEIFDKYQELDAGFYKANRTGDLMNRISEDVNRVRMYLGPAVMYTLNLIVLVAMCIVVMLGIDAELTMYTLLPLPFMMILIYYVSTVINKRTEKVQAQQSKLSTMVQESISGIRVIKAFGKEARYSDEFKKESDHYKNMQLHLVTGDALFMPVITLLVGLSTILTIYIGAGKVMAQEITIGVIVQFVFYVNQLTWPFASVGWVTSLVQKAEAAQERINEFLSIRPAIVNPAAGRSIAAEEIQFEQVQFRYAESGIQALRGVDLHIKKGQHIAIVGSTGSGKSTLASLMMRMYDPSEGVIKGNGHDLRSVDLYQWRSSIGYVPQDVFLFSDTIANNIAFGNEDARREDIEKAAVMAGIHDEIVRLEKGYDTLLGERGINLSGGQKQRISIARALVKNPRMLILDDCLSAVDTATEDWILGQLREHLKGSTILSFAHRLSTIRDASYVYVLQEGCIVEEGQPQILLASNSRFSQMMKMQTEQAEGRAS